MNWEDALFTILLVISTAEQVLFINFTFIIAWSNT